MATQGMDLEAMKQDLSEKASEVMDRAVEFARERPHAAVGIAFGVGWVLGNGLPPRLVTGALRIGWRMALGGLIARGGLGDLIGEGADGEVGNGGGAAGSKSEGSTTRRRGGHEASSAGARGAGATKD